MSGCCEPPGYSDLFGARFSRHLAARYRRKGLDRTAARMVAFLEAQGLHGASVLEVGGGVGDIQLELLRRGASRATNLELVDSYEADARDLAAESGLEDRMTRRQVDLARTPDAVEPHDIVVLHRVVCCYADSFRLLEAAAARATRLLVFSHPPGHVLSRVVSGAENLWFRLRGRAFRTWVHDPRQLVAAAEQGRLATAYRHRGAVWHVVGLAAAPAGEAASAAAGAP